MTSLTPGTTYYARAFATNSSGVSYGTTVPFTTSKLTQTITFDNPGSQKFGTTLTLSATTTATGLAVSLTSGTTSVCGIASDGMLTFLSTGTCTIDANQAGNATYSAASTVSRSFAVNAVAPGAPTIGTATATASGQATVTFTAPAFTGGSAITGYTVVSNPGGITGTGSSSPITVTGLTNGVSYTFTVAATNGTSYTFTVTATNSVGTGPASTVSDAIVPKTTQTITFADLADVTYGVADFAPAVTTTYNLNVTLTSDNTDVARITMDGLVQVVGAGSATITATQPGNDIYLAAEPVSKVLNVAKALLTITALNDTITEGDAEPLLQIDIKGYVNMDNFSVFVDQGATREPGTKAGKYKITPIVTTTTTEYELKFVNGWFVILAAAPTSALPAMAQNASVRRVPGGLALTGLRGDLELFSLQGDHVRTIHADHDGHYAMPLRLDMYVLRSGARVWTIAPGDAR